MTKILISTFLLLTTSTLLSATHFNKVMIVVFENTDFQNALKQPYFSSLTKQGALLTNYKALTHPSQPNYVAMISGTTNGVTDDRNVDLSGKHIGDILEEGGKSWKAYAEDYPGNCFTGATSGKYARKHVPFLSFLNVTKNPSRCAKIVGLNDFASDLQKQSLPDYSLYIPNLDNDAHDTGVGFGDKWLKTNFGPILNSKNLPKDLLIVITFDEGSRFGNNQIYTLMLGGNVKAGAQSAKSYNVYSLLKTIEEELGLSSLKQNDLSAPLIDDIWN
jgi:hypothetical protein